MAAIFSQLLFKESLEHLRKDKEDPLEIPAEHDPQKLEGSRLFMKHLHIVVEHPPAGEFELLAAHVAIFRFNSLIFALFFIVPPVSLQ